MSFDRRYVTNDGHARLADIPDEVDAPRHYAPRFESAGGTDFMDVARAEAIGRSDRCYTGVEEHRIVGPPGSADAERAQSSFEISAGDVGYDREFQIRDAR